MAKHWATEKARLTLNPPRVESALRRLQEIWPAEEKPLPEVMEAFPLGENALLHLLAVSSICATRLLQTPDMLLWLSQPHICDADRGPRRMRADLDAFAGTDVAGNNFRALRIWKGREITRIALREVAEKASLEETMLELSHLADICLETVHHHWDAELRRRSGSPSTGLAIVALGKLGARELNHSSDVDVMFIYGEEGAHGAASTHHEWCNRLAAKIAQTFSASDPAGALFRIDLRLRPEGTHGPLARSLESMENYYAGFGESWERLMLMKARGVCGNREVAYEFIHQHQPFIYPRSPTPDLLDEVAGIKRRIERDVVGHEDLERNVKLGAGGIREIEFVVQALQLLHGARNAFLQETSTLKALAALRELELLPPADVQALDGAYRFLRTVEHRLQIEAEQQTHTLPSEPEALGRVALSLGFPGVDQFREELARYTQGVRQVFQRVVSVRSTDSSRSPPLSAIFRDEARAARALADLAQAQGSFHVAPRTQQVFRRLQPLLLAQLSGTGDPDMALTQLLRFVEAYGMRSMLFELLVSNPRLLELLVRTFDASRFAGDLLIRRPQLLEEITRRSDFNRTPSVAEHLAQLRGSPEIEAVRSYRQSHLLRILLRDVLGLAGINEVAREHANLAEACLIVTHLQATTERDVTVIALGKFGGGELSYGSDLDVVFVGTDSRPARALVATMGLKTAEGALGVLDSRLRPDGEKGPLVVPLEGFVAYYEGRAQFWELQTLTRARAIAGPAGDDFIAAAQAAWRRAGRLPGIEEKIGDMLGRIQRDRSRGNPQLDFKTGAGGIVEAEFLVQLLQMRHDVWEPNWSRALGLLVDREIVPETEAAALRGGYELLRRIESALRRWENTGVSILPADEFGQFRLARWLGFESAASFWGAYAAARETIHALYGRLTSREATAPSR